MPNTDDLNAFIDSLRQSGFSGDIESGYAERVVAATDNSIYQLMPQAILYPRCEEDIERAMRCVFTHRDQGLSLCARGGGTGTNGQSLTHSLILDCARHLNQILDFDAEAKTVTVQPGVVLDQLNAFLKPHGLFFPIDISSSSRATLGGMVATDASGKGSLIYGKTSDHIESLQLTLSDGRDYLAGPLNLQQLEEAGIHSEILAPIYQQLDGQREEIARVFPRMNRGLSGYNLAHSIASPSEFNPCYLFAGAEGTLALTRRITLRVIPRPTHRLLSVVFYEDFLKGLEHVQVLLESQPAAIEMLDDKILGLARNDSVWFDVQSVLQDLPADKPVRAALFVEHVGFDTQTIEQQKQLMDDILNRSANQYSAILSRTETDPGTINALWSLRKRAVGLLGHLQDDKRAIAFVEDTAVPPQNLTHYVSAFRQVLDEHGLEYGMYGHADAGVLHVRPALNLMQEKDRVMIRSISDQVAQLAIENGGVLWGEHGRGFRGEYTPLFFGEKLYPLLCDIKKHFDPFNLLNPGKLTTPDPQQAVIALDAVTLRGQLDEQIPETVQQNYLDTLYCNGNGACFNASLSEAMCPSYKATRNKLYSPKGRAAMLREWARLSHQDTHRQELQQLEHSLFESLQHCLSCKSCTSTCPLKVDIPELKSRFLEHWFHQHRRHTADWFQRHFETLIDVGGRVPRLSNLVLHSPVTAPVLAKLTGLNRLPRFSKNRLAVPVIDITALKNQPDCSNTLILLRDNYLNRFDQDTLNAAARLLQKFGYQVFFSKTIRNGKLLHVKGFRKAFQRQAQQVVDQLLTLQQTGATLVSMETVTRLMLEHEYPKILGDTIAVNVRSIESLLSQALAEREIPALTSEPRAALLLPHCLEQTTARDSAPQWQAVYDKLGIPLRVTQAGCCGMSGLFGHERINNSLSDDIFKLQWQATIRDCHDIVLASGFSCRCQLENQQFSVQHPVSYLHSLFVD